MYIMKKMNMEKNVRTESERDVLLSRGFMMVQDTDKEKKEETDTENSETGDPVKKETKKKDLKGKAAKEGPADQEEESEPGSVEK